MRTVNFVTCHFWICDCVPNGRTDSAQSACHFKPFNFKLQFALPRPTSRCPIRLQMEIYCDISDRHTGDAAANPRRDDSNSNERPPAASTEPPPADKQDKENAAAAGLRLRPPSHSDSDAEEDLKGRRRAQPERSQRTVLEDVTHRYHSSSESDDMLVETVDDGEVVQPMQSMQPMQPVQSVREVQPGQLARARARPSPTRKAKSLRMKRVVDKSFTRRMR